MKGLYLHYLKRWYPWLLSAEYRDINQEIELFCLSHIPSNNTKQNIKAIAQNVRRFCNLNGYRLNKPVKHEYEQNNDFSDAIETISSVLSEVKNTLNRRKTRALQGYLYGRSANEIAERINAKPADVQPLLQSIIDKIREVNCIDCEVYPPFPTYKKGFSFRKKHQVDRPSINRIKIDSNETIKSIQTKYKCTKDHARVALKRGWISAAGCGYRKNK